MTTQSGESHSLVYCDDVLSEKQNDNEIKRGVCGTDG